ncbi:MAG: hypothetical protein H7644_08895 [Candidatus Heimdallarchaeota archaeon]|nr:hypothetical protein [Candidatus Heimdallarchaeota archaeon]MCK5143871.1 hypothetical protein [Candidatus Heimdallarchaeota archaeon]
MKKVLKLSLVVLMISAFLANTISAQTGEGLYYSDKMVKNGTFTWNVTKSVDYYEDIPVGANFTVKLKDDLYPGPLSEEELEKVYASVKVDGDKYTGEGFPLFWHTHRINATDTVYIRDEFEDNPTLFNVTDGTGTWFYVNFTVEDAPYSLYVEFEIDPLDGVTKKYYEHFVSVEVGNEIDSEIELTYLGYIWETPLQFGWVFFGLLSIGALVIIRKKRTKTE